MILTVILFKLIGHWNVFKICTINGFKWLIPQKFVKKLQIITIVKGFRERASNRFINLFVNDGVGWLHLLFVFSHSEHWFELSRYCFSSLSSFWITLSGTQPRSHCNDLEASLSRFLESNQIGVSGIFKFY